METRAVNKYIQHSSKKIIPMLNLVRGKRVEYALNTLHFLPNKAAKIVEGTIRSAVSNYIDSEEGSKVNPEDLVIKEAYVDKGPITRRIQPRSMGRAYLIRKRTSHVTIKVGLPAEAERAQKTKKTEKALRKKE
ncbi:MAG: 50S ribosomal protein L22 [Candidatus Marinimicrobia bacterium]|nr:50S ribosomal protein L22 [Candidatus Neomarinimicrobiota bacterium]MDD5581859.1 50S ribosomal protein L22 [Candidatus Neomarinimicrobiota bacterium]